MYDEARLLTFEELRRIKGESILFLETKQTLRPAYYYGIIENTWAKGDERYAVHLLTPSKMVKHWQMRLYNITWRLWDSRPTREQRMEERWDA